MPAVLMGLRCLCHRIHAALRQMPGSNYVVRFDDVIDALQALDENAANQDSRRTEGSQPRGRDRNRDGGPEEGSTDTGNWF